MRWLDQQLADRYVAHGIDLLRFTSGVRAKVLAILERMSVELTARVLDEPMGVRGKARLESLLIDTNDIIEHYYFDASALAAKKLAGLAAAEPLALRAALHDAGQVIGIELSTAMPSAHLLEAMASDVLIEKAPSKQWWAQQGRNMVWRFSNEVRQGMSQGETNAQIVGRIVGAPVGKGQAPRTAGVMPISRADAARLVHASVQTVANTAREMAFQANRDILAGVQQLSTLDGHTTATCIAYSGAQWDMDHKPINGTTLPYNNGCPRHWNCRSVMVPMTKSLRSMGIDLPDFEPTTRAASSGHAGGQVKASTSMKDWLGTRTTGQLDEQLGKGRAQLYRDGVITLQQLLDVSGSPLSMKQLSALYG